MRTSHLFAVTLSAASVVSLGRKLTGAAVIPSSVEFKHAAPPRLREHVRLFGVTPRFDRPKTVLTFDTAVLGLAIRSPRTGVLAYLDAYAREVLAKLPADEEFLGQLERAIAVDMGRGSDRARSLRRAHLRPAVPAAPRARRPRAAARRAGRRAGARDRDHRSARLRRNRDEGAARAGGPRARAALSQRRVVTRPLAAGWLHWRADAHSGTRLRLSSAGRRAKDGVHADHRMERWDARAGERVVGRRL